MLNFSIKFNFITNTFAKPIAIYFFVGLIALGIRLYFNFSQELIPGVNGGYYPLQVRFILENGYLAFPDMPLLFYFDAFLIKVISFLGIDISDKLILFIVKLIDSISLPLLLIPLYKIFYLLIFNKPLYIQTSIILFAILSFSPLILTSDLQKNSLAITFLFFFLHNFISFQIYKKTSDFFKSFILLLIIGLTHFGTFSIALLILGLINLFTYKRKAFIPIFITLIFGIIIISTFDISRLNRLVNFWMVIFEKPLLTNAQPSPPDIFNIIISFSLVILGIFILKIKSKILSHLQKRILLTNICLLLFLSFPLLDVEYFKRLNLFLFIPQTLILIQITSIQNIKNARKTSIIIIAITILSILAVIGRPKRPFIDEVAYKELKYISTIITNNNQTIVIANHGLEWWIAWILNVKISQDKSFNEEILKKYSNIYVIIQDNGFGDYDYRKLNSNKRIPINSEIIYLSYNFRIFRLKNSNSKLNSDDNIDASL